MTSSGKGEAFRTGGDGVERLPLCSPPLAPGGCHADDSEPKLELLIDFDDPASFTLAANAPLTSGVRRTASTWGGVEGALSLNSDDELLADWREIGVPPLTEE
ncbi:hypothetical protein TcBrA4_0049510 [Trypanosoma cruzi]|nr:hypothetical protein TcBrA4_0049510 [Trypanosoma cruzi]